MSNDNSVLAIGPAFAYYKENTGRSAPFLMIMAEVLFTIACGWTIAEGFIIDQSSFSATTLVFVMPLAWILKMTLSKGANQKAKNVNDFAFIMYKRMIICYWVVVIISLLLFESCLNSAYNNGYYSNFIKIHDTMSYAYYMFGSAFVSTLFFLPLIVKKNKTPDVQYAVFSIRVMKLVNMIDDANAQGRTYDKKQMKEVKKRGGL